MKNIVRACDVYRTGDVALAAALSLWYPLDALDRHADGPVIFVFRRDVHLDNLLEDYWRGRLRVEPQAYCQQIYVLQRRVCQERH